MQPRPQGFSIKNVFEGKALGTRLSKMGLTGLLDSPARV